ncbi:MAG TPA: hypothetical protein VFQ38_09215 [Longimicrobiales bacterium]|nr:hypothetical protein [Longimicrobiales bacterium]
MVRFGVGALLSLAAAGSLAAQRGRPPREPLAVVANAAVPDRALSPAQVRRIFLARQRFWADGSPVEPVNLPATSPVRDTFSRAILGRPPRDLVEFWNDLYFHGIQPPPVVDSERAVLLYVARTPGAVGYVSESALPPPAERTGYRTVLVVRP